MNRDQGAVIINLSSVAANIILPKAIQYCAGKSYDYYLSEFIDIETRLNKNSKKLDVLCLQPGYVDTPLTSKSKNKVLEINRYECAESSLKCLGSTSRTGGHWKHLIMNSLTRIFSSLSWILK